MNLTLWSIRKQGLIPNSFIPFKLKLHSFIVRFVMLAAAESLRSPKVDKELGFILDRLVIIKVVSLHLSHLRNEVVKYSASRVVLVTNYFTIL